MASMMILKSNKLVVHYLMIPSSYYCRSSSKRQQLGRYCKRYITTSTASTSTATTSTTSTSTSTSTATTSTAKNGHLGIAALKAKGWVPWAEDLASQAVAIADQLSTPHSSSSMPPATFLRHIDQISSLICSVTDAAELIRSMTYHHHHHHQAHADQAYQVIHRVIERLNGDQRLYSAFRKKIFDAPGVFDSLSPEYRNFAMRFLMDFEAYGIHLPDKERAAVADLKVQIQMATHQYTVESEKESYESFSVPTSIAKPDKIATFRRKNSMLSANDCEDIIASTPSASARENLYEYVLKAKWNGHAGGHALEALEQLLQLRLTLAKKLGFDSYSAMVLRENMVKTPQAVLQFLRKEHEQWRGQALTSYQALLSEKRKTEPSADQIYAFDVPYYKQVIRGSTETYEQLVSESTNYLSLANCIDGLNLVAQKVFGLMLVEARTEDGETWHPDVFKLAVVEQDSKRTMGYIYFDLLQRPGKLQASSHYTINLAHKKYNLDLPVQSGGQPSNNSNYDNYTIPKVAISTAFPSSGGLNLTEASTLFHEFGHCLHSVLSRGEFQHLAGTRGPFDFVELPSVLLERFPLDWDVLKLFARHKTSGKTMPVELYKQLMRTRNMFEGLEAMESITMSVLDQRLHGTWAGTRLDQAGIRNITRDTFNEFSTVHHTPSGSVPFPAALPHLGSYASNYYSYIYVKTLRQATWNSLFKLQPLTRAGGDKFRQTILSIGCSKDYRDAVVDLLGSFPPSLSTATV